MEEARNLKLERLKAEKDNLVITEKLKLAKKRINDLECIITEYRQRESGHIVAGHFGNNAGVSEEDINDIQDEIQDVNVMNNIGGSVTKSQFSGVQQTITIEHE